MQWAYMGIPSYEEKAMEQKITKSQWKKLYINRLALAIGHRDAMANYNAMDINEIDYEIHPAIAADDEISYMKSES